MSYHNIPALEINSDEISVVPYSKETLAKYLSFFSNTDLDEVIRKTHLTFFESYFARMGVQNIVIEYPYIDKDYLEDFSAYYARSYEDYKKQTLRLHFFAGDKINKHSLGEILKKEKSLPECGFTDDMYIGYMVVKPIPGTMIGKTVLKTYPENSEGRGYPINRLYKANLYGISLTLESIGYQEQDKTVAACATSALWSVFQSTGFLFQHAIPSPAEITRLATENSHFIDRAFPNKGLSLEQIANCIKALKLEPQYQDVNEYQFLKAFVNAYLHAKIPVLLGTSLYSVKQEEFLGEHAVAVMGFSKALKNTSNFYGMGVNDKKLYLTSSRIDKIFVHDDQIGPYARMEFDDPFNNRIKRVESNGATTHFASITTSWATDNNPEIRAVPNTVLVPLYHKIRIPFEKIFLVVSKLNFEINNLVDSDEKLLVDEWDIVLDINKRFKEELLEAANPNEDESQRILIKSLPRFFWRAKAIVEDEVLFEFLFDATDIAEGKLFLDFICYDMDYIEWLYSIMKAGINLQLIKDKHARYFIGKMMERIETYKL